MPSHAAGLGRAPVMVAIALVDKVPPWRLCSAPLPVCCLALTSAARLTRAWTQRRPWSSFVRNARGLSTKNSLTSCARTSPRQSPRAPSCRTGPSRLYLATERGARGEREQGRLPTKDPPSARRARLNFLQVSWAFLKGNNWKSSCGRAARVTCNSGFVSSLQ